MVVNVLEVFLFGHGGLESANHINTSFFFL